MTADACGGDLVAEWMAEFDVGWFFHVPGETFLPVLEGLRSRPEIQVVTMRHESGASFAAEAVGKLRGRAAVCMATRGPGSANLAIGLQTAHYDATPVIALVTQVPRNLADSGAFQEADPSRIFGSTAKAVLRVQSVAALTGTLTQAHSIAHSGRPGPVVVAIPTDVLNQPADLATDRPGYRLVEVRAELSSRIVDLLATAARPIVLVSTAAVRRPEIDDLARACQGTGLPVVTGWRRFSAFPNDSGSYVGGIGASGAPSTLAALGEADLVISFGFGVETMTTHRPAPLSRETTVVQIAPELDERSVRLIGGAGAIEFVVADPYQHMTALNEWVRHNPATAEQLRARHGQRTQDLRMAYERSLAVLDRPRSCGPVRTEYLVKAMDKVMPSDAIVASDAGNFARWLLRYCQFGAGRTFLGPVNGAMGYGLPSAVGASLACPGRPVWCVAGDGGFLMTASEAETASRLDLGIVAVVVNNGAYGSIRRDQERRYPGVRPEGTLLGAVDFGTVVRGLGWVSVRCDSEARLAGALEEVSGMTGNRLLEVVTDPMELEL